jgi:serine/threonine protein kinase
MPEAAGRMRPVTDDVLPDRFEDAEFLDRGSMGEVYVARERDLYRRVAVKVLSSGFEGEDAKRARFLREIRITAQLEHPNIVPIYAFEATANDVLAFSMKLIRGRTLQTYIGTAADSWQDGGSPAADHGLAVRLDHFGKVCDAIGYAHDKGVIHRDLKPANIMLGDHGEVYVMDWGVAKALAGGAVEGAEDLEEDTNTEPVGNVGTLTLDGTMVGTAVGTPQYMSPEQASGASDLDARSDQYALGLVLFELVALVPAIPSPTPMVALGNAMMGEQAALEHVAGRPIAPELRAIINKATAIQRGDRYANVAALAHDLRRFRAGDPVLAKPDTTSQAAARWIGKHRQSALLILLGLLLILFGSTTFSLWQASRSAAVAAAREEALGELLTAASVHAHAIDERFLTYEGLLESLVAAGVHALDGPPRPDVVSVLTVEDFENPERAPADYGDALAYGGWPISVEQPVFVTAPDFDPRRAELLAKLAPLGERMRRVMLQSRARDAIFSDLTATRARIAEEGVPVVWTYIGLEEGVHVAFPGKAGYPDDYDPRLRPWYRLAARKYGPNWGRPYVDALGQGLLLPCAMAIYDGAGTFRGVAGIELTFRFLSEELLDLPSFKGRVDAVLLDDEGRVVVRSGGKVAAKVGKDGALELPLFPHESVIEPIREGRSGWTAIDGNLVAYHRMAATGWYYLVIGPLDGLGL